MFCGKFVQLVENNDWRMNAWLVVRLPGSAIADGTFWLAKEKSGKICQIEKQQKKIEPKRRRGKIYLQGLLRDKKKQEEELVGNGFSVDATAADHGSGHLPVLL